MKRMRHSLHEVQSTGERRRALATTRAMRFIRILLSAFAIEHLPKVISGSLTRLRTENGLSSPSDGVHGAELPPPIRILFGQSL
jgi:hypothetical protein